MIKRNDLSRECRKVYSLETWKLFEKPKNAYKDPTLEDMTIFTSKREKHRFAFKFQLWNCEEKEKQIGFPPLVKLSRLKRDKLKKKEKPIIESK